MVNVGPPDKFGVAQNIPPGRYELKNCFNPSVPLRDLIIPYTNFHPEKNYIIILCGWQRDGGKNILHVLRKESRLEKRAVGSPPSDPEPPFNMILFILPARPDMMERHFWGLKTDREFDGQALKAIAPELAEANITLGDTPPYTRLTSVGYVPALPEGYSWTVRVREESA